MDLKLAEKLKLAELKLSQKYHVLQEELEDKAKNGNGCNDQIVAKLKTELKVTIDILQKRGKILILGKKINRIAKINMISPYKSYMI